MIKHVEGEFRVSNLLTEIEINKFYLEKTLWIYQYGRDPEVIIKKRLTTLCFVSLDSCSSPSRKSYSTKSCQDQALRYVVKFTSPFRSLLKRTLYKPKLNKKASKNK